MTSTPSTTAPSATPTDVTAGLMIEPSHLPYPDIEPFATGMLDVGDGQQIYYEQSGNPTGLPVLYVHGGPGGGLDTCYRKFFDPQAYRIIGFDQRGCGLSTPNAASLISPEQMNANSTPHLLGDMEQLRTSLGLDTWMLFGGSWGSGLSLKYAESYPRRVTALMLRGIFTLRKLELDWYYNQGASFIYPDRWEGFLAPLRAAGYNLGRDNITTYHDLLWSSDRSVAEAAGVAWTSWEAATSNLLYPEEHVREESDPCSALTFARIENHYFVHHGWWGEGELIANAGRLADIPGVIVQGRYDMCCPAVTSYDLHQAWPQADYRVVAAGHSAYEPNITAELVAAADALAHRYT